jgi:repressor LexA
MTAPLTKRQKEVLDAIAAWIKENGYSPSYEEIGAAVGVTSLATVATHLRYLRDKGYIRYGYNSTRSIEIIRESVRALKSCDAGHPICWFAGNCPACGMRGAA